MYIYNTYAACQYIYIDIFRHSARVGFVSYNWSLLIKLMRCYTLCPPKTNMTMEKATIWRCISHWTNVMLTPDADLGGPDMYRWRGCPSTEWSVWHHWIVRWSSGRMMAAKKGWICSCRSGCCLIYPSAVHHWYSKSSNIQMNFVRISIFGWWIFVPFRPRKVVAPLLSSLQKCNSGQRGHCSALCGATRWWTLGLRFRLMVILFGFG